MEQITARIKGGLGNQLFQFAYAYSQSLTHRAQLNLDLSYFKRDSRHGGYLLQHLDLPDTVQIKNINAMTQLLLRINEKTGNGLNALLNLGYRIDKFEEYYPTKRNIVIDGYWQGEHYFLEHASYIKKIYQAALAPFAKQENILHTIHETNSVSVHIRRGDYANNPVVTKIHGVLNLGYYQSAVDYLERRHADLSYFIFSDDIDWAKRNLEFIGNRRVMEIAASTPFTDLSLMASCRHNIIANSTFSWWGAWLNQHLDKVVIAPRQWFADEKMNLQNNIVPDSWVTL